MELEYWRRRMTRLHSMAEQLASAEHRAVAAVCTAAGVPVCTRWRDLELRLADAAAEAKETVKYLATLEGSLECIYFSALAAGHVCVCHDVAAVVAEVGRACGGSWRCKRMQPSSRQNPDCGGCGWLPLGCYCNICCAACCCFTHLHNICALQRRPRRSWMPCP